MSEENRKLRVLCVEPGKPPEVKEIGSDLTRDRKSVV